MALASVTNHDNIFNELRETSLKLLREKTTGAWTDHNLHDPGITILETLCYAISELALKNNLDIKQLMGVINSDPELPDFLDKTILFNAALNQTDYRKLLLGHRYAKNAWVDPYFCSGGMYYDSTPKSLSFVDTSSENIQVYLKGLNSILFEMEISEAGAFLPASDTDLNNNIISRIDSVISPGMQVNFETAFPFWDEAPAILAEGLPINPIAATVNTTAIPLSYLVDLVITLISGGGTVPVPLSVYVSLIPSLPGFAVSEINQKNAIRTLLESNAADAPVPVFLEKMKRTKKTVNDLIDFLHSSRNMAEDHAEFKVVRTQEIAVETDLRITSFIPAEKVLAKLYRQLEKWFNPDIPLYTASELTAKNWPIEKIYEGPNLDKYFVDESDLPRSDFQDSIHISDLVGMFMNTEGVDALEGFGISNYINNLLITSHQRNSLTLVNPIIYKPRFSRGKSKLRVFQDGVLRVPDPVVIDEYERALAITEALPAIPTAVNQIQQQPDIVEEIRTYYSIQNDFPMVYGLREGELSLEADVLRKAQSRQLKAYLVHFEQLLANYTAQLSSLKEIFSIDPQIKTTYPSNPLYDVPAISEVLNSFIGSTNGDWIDFKNDDSNPYAIAVANTDTNFIARRQLFLDHLLARLSHSPEDFTALRATSVADPDVEQKIIAQKCHFIQKFSVISAERGKSFCYRSSPGIDIWDTKNVSGLEKRVAQFLDVKDFKRQDLGTAKEGFFLIEHILLRPSKNEPVPIPFLLPESKYSATALSAPGYIADYHKDPYSFRITFVFPALTGRFLDRGFQKKAEKVLALETPAHLLWDAYWITDAAVQSDFETVLHDWLDLHSMPAPAEEPARSTFFTNWSGAKAKVIKYINHFRLSKYTTDAVPRELAPPWYINSLPI